MKGCSAAGAVRWGALRLCVLLGLTAHAVFAGELDFAYVRTWPQADGAVVDHEGWRDATSGLEVRRVIHEMRADGEVRRTHVVSAVCGTLAPAHAAARRQPFIVAIRRWSVDPSSGPEAEERARFASVHVREPTSKRIRFYRDVAPLDLAQLTRTMLPYCSPT